YVLSRDAWVIDHLFEPHTGSLLRIRHRTVDRSYQPQVALAGVARAAAAAEAQPPAASDRDRATPATNRVTLSGELRQWHNVVLTLDGPRASELDRDPNPF